MTVPVTRIPLRRFADERGWFMELMRSSLLPKPVRQSNVSFSRKGVIRGLHFHERGAIYVPGTFAHGYEALTDCVFLYHVTEEYDPAGPDEHVLCWADERVKNLWSTEQPILSERDTAACS